MLAETERGNLPVKSEGGRRINQLPLKALEPIDTVKLEASRMTDQTQATLVQKTISSRFARNLTKRVRLTAVAMWSRIQWLGNRGGLT